MFYQGFLLYKIYMINFFYSVLSIASLILIIIAGVYHFKNKERLKYSYILTIGGILSLLWTTCIPNLLNALYFEPKMTIELYEALIFYLYLIPTSILSIITFGGVFIFVGVKNSRFFGIYLRSSGILWCISGLLKLFAAIGYNGYTYVDYIPPPDESLRITLKIINYIAIAITIIAIAFLLIFAMKLVNSLLGITALILIIENFMILILNIYLNGII